MAIKRLHYFIADVLVLYKSPEGEPRQRRLNTFFAKEEKKIPLLALHNMRQSVTGTLVQQTGIDEKDVIDIVFGAITYLGHMTEKEFSAQDEPKQEKPTIPGYSDPNPRLS